MEKIMGRKLTFIFDNPPMGHNSLSADFVHPRGIQAPHVTGRERGVITGCYPRDIQYYHTKADDPGEWLNYLCPNAARLPVSDRLVAVRTQKRRLIMVD